jgi:DNA-binding IclR family transcriptional regulator
MSTSTEDARVKSTTGAGGESARRVLRLLLSFSKQRHTLSARDLSAATGIPLPSVYRYVALLRESALLVGDDQGGYRLSARFAGLAQAAEAADSLIEIADPVMRELAGATGETVLLVRLVNDAAVCVHRIESSHPLRISFEPGQPLSLENGASARILLAAMPPRQRHATLASLRERDPERAAALAAGVAEVEHTHWATSEEEIDPGIWAAAAAIRDRHRIVAALSVPSPLVRAPEAAREQRLSQVRAAADEIGGRWRSAFAETTQA